MKDTDRSENARELALSTLISTEKSRKYTNIESDVALKGNPLREDDRKLYT